MRATSSTIIGLLLATLVFGSAAEAATIVYDDELHTGWASWSWGGEFSFDHSDEVLSGTYSIAVTVEQYGSLSLHSERAFPQASGVSFWLRGEGDSLVVFLHADGEETIESDQVTIADLTETTPDDWVFVSAIFDGFDSEDWTRINIMNTSEEPISFWVDDIILQGVDFSVEEPLDEATDAGIDLGDDATDMGDDLAEVGPDEGDDQDGSDDAVAEDLADNGEPDEDEGWGCQTATGRPPGLTLWMGVLGWFGCLRSRKWLVHATR